MGLLAPEESREDAHNVLQDEIAANLADRLHMDCPMRPIYLGAAGTERDALGPRSLWP